MLRSLRRRELAFNSASTLVAFGLNVVLEVVAVPIYLGHLGTASFGVFAMLVSAVGYFSLIDFGIPRGITKLLSESGDPAPSERRSAIVGIALSAHLVLAIVTSVLMYLLFAGLFAFLMPEAGHDQQSFAQLRLLASGCVFLAVLGSAGEGVLRGLQRYASESVIFSIAKVSTTILGIWLVVATGSVVWLLVSVALFHLMATVAKVAYAARLVHPRVPNWVEVSEFGRRIKAFGSWVFVDSLLLQLIFRLPLIVVGMAKGPAEAGLYSVGQKVCVALHGSFQAGTDVLFPHVSARLGKVHHALGRSLLQAGLFAAVVGTPLYFVMALWANDILTTWISAEVAGGASVILILLSVAFYLLSLAWVNRNFLLGAGQVRTVTFATAGGVAVMLVILGATSDRWGAAGAGLAMVGASSAMAFVYVWRSVVLFGVSGWRHLRALVWPHLLVLVAAYTVVVVLPRTILHVRGELLVELPLVLLTYAIYVLQVLRTRLVARAGTVERVE